MSRPGPSILHEASLDSESYDGDTPEEMLTIQGRAQDQKAKEFEVQGLLAALLNLGVAQAFGARLAILQRNLERQVLFAAQCGKANGFGGDYGVAVAESGAGGLKKRKPGGHKTARGRARAEIENERRAAELAAAPVGSDARCWPTPGELLFFRSVASIYPCSDFRHPIVTPSQLLLGEFLSRCPIRGPRDVVAALCTSQLLLMLLPRGGGMGFQYGAYGASCAAAPLAPQHWRRFSLTSTDKTTQLFWLSRRFKPVLGLLAPWACP